MSLIDQFIEPHGWWEEYEENANERYERTCQGRTCLDCARCERATVGMLEDIGAVFGIGWCLESESFVTQKDEPLAIGCECFTQRSAAA